MKYVYEFLVYAAIFAAIISGSLIVLRIVASVG
jgi:hypothetical protein